MIADFPRVGALPDGGVQVSVQRLVEALEAAGVEAAVIAPDPGADETNWATDGDHQVVHVPTERRWGLARGLRAWRRRAQQILAEIRPDVVHGHGAVAAGLAAADATAFPRALTAYGNVGEDTRAAYAGATRRIRGHVRDRFARYTATHVDAVVGVHPDWRVNLPVEPRWFVHIPGIVEDRFFDGRRQSDSHVVFFAGGPRTIKGWPVLAEAWPAVLAAVPEARLVAAGWPPEEANAGVEAELAASIEIRRALSTDELAAEMAHAQVLAIPSLYEVAPLILTEAWAMQLPVVASAVGGIPGLAEGAALLVPPHSAHELAQALIRALRSEPGLDTLVEEGHRRSLAHRREAVAAKHIRLYERLVAERLAASG